MRFYSTSNRKLTATLSVAVTQGLAPDGGLWMPEQIPQLSAEFFETISDRTFQEIAIEFARHLLGSDVSQVDLQTIVRDAINFDAPLVQLRDGISVLELWHGPTLAFKDFGARFMARLLVNVSKQSGQDVTVLVATSGDTGSAVASGFYNVAGVRVVILYPSGKVSRLQELQLTTMGGNITALEVEGTFDDCQRLVKQAFGDSELTSAFHLTSANSINIARLIPQSFYYVWAYAQLEDKERAVVVSVPCGNFGNLTAGLIAKRMGLPIARFIAATNSNDVFGEYLQSGTYRPRTSQPTISNAMDVGNPSNLARIQALYSHDLEGLQRDVVHAGFTDAQTITAIQEVFKKDGYTLDPHGAVGYLGLTQYLKESPDSRGIFFATAHPAKFPEVVESAIGQSVKTPARLAVYLDRTKESQGLSADFDMFKNALRSIHA